MTAFVAAIAYANSKGVAVFVASGDNDSGDGESGTHVDFPASAPPAIGCGGTLISGSTEVVWNDGMNEGTGGGFSATFAPPSCQVPFNTAGKRSVPDVAGDADPGSGWLVSVNGDIQVIGGTSMVAPMWAGLFARLQQTLGKPVTQAQLYAASATFRDIVSGNNGTYQAKVGFDQCSGLGVPNGKALLAALQAVTPEPTPTPVPPAPTPTPAPIPPQPPAPSPPPTAPTEASIQTPVDAVFVAAVQKYATTIIGRSFIIPALEAVAPKVDAAIKTAFNPASEEDAIEIPCTWNMWVVNKQ